MKPHGRILYLQAAATALLAAIGLSSCKSSGGSSSVPRWDPSSAPMITGSAATPPHNLPRSEYPFDAQGNYVTAWVREGASKYGHSTSSTSSASHSYKPASSPSGRSSSSSSSSSSYRTHKVVADDTLYGLSRRYGTSVAAIKRANGMSSDTIVNGRTLKIPR